MGISSLVSDWLSMFSWCLVRQKYSIELKKSVGWRMLNNTHNVYMINRKIDSYNLPSFLYGWHQTLCWNLETDQRINFLCHLYGIWTEKYKTSKRWCLSYDEKQLDIQILEFPTKLTTGAEASRSCSERKIHTPVKKFIQVLIEFW